MIGFSGVCGGTPIATPNAETKEAHDLIHKGLAMNRPIAMQDSANSNLPIKPIAMTVKQNLLKLDLGKDYYKMLRLILEYALMIARNAERLRPGRNRKSSDSIRSPSLTRIPAF